MADGEQDWIAKYRAALDANPIEEHRSLRVFLADLAKKLGRRPGWILSTRRDELQISSEITQPTETSAGSLHQEQGTIDDSRKPAALESILVKKAG
jgi:hypothetical protein